MAVAAPHSIRGGLHPAGAEEARGHPAHDLEVVGMHVLERRRADEILRRVAQRLRMCGGDDR